MQPAPLSEHGFPCVNIHHVEDGGPSCWAGCRNPETCSRLRACAGVPF